MKSRNILYIVITIICVIAIVMAVYYQIFGNDENPSIGNNVGNTQVNNPDEIDLEKIKNEFNNIFTNTLNTQGNEVKDIEKRYSDKEIVYSIYTIKEEKEDKYSVNLNLPLINIKTKTANELNQITQKVFVNKANEILEDTEFYTIYNVEYAAYINENILSLVIKSTLKEGTNAQRVIVQTYNYDLETGEKANLKDILENKQVNKDEINRKIEKQVSYAAAQAELISQATSQTVYKRDLNNAMYLIDNVNSFFIGEDGKIYIVYAYGNSNFTSEIDIIEI